MKKNFIKAVFCFLFIAQAGVSFAQDSVHFKTKMLTISPGYAYADVSGLNRFLAPGTSGFSQNFAVLGLESTTECRRFIYGATLQGGMSQTTTVTNYNAVAGNNMEYSASFLNAMLHGGYSIVSTKRIKFYPLLGAGFGGMNGNFSRIDNQTIAQFANDPGVQGRVTKYMACFDGSLGLDVLFPSKRWSENLGSVLGIRVGYTQGVGIGNWQFASARIIENPTYNPGMVYAKLQIGLFRKYLKRDCRDENCGRTY